MALTMATCCRGEGDELAVAALAEEVGDVLAVGVAHPSGSEMSRFGGQQREDGGGFQRAG